MNSCYLIYHPEYIWLFVHFSIESIDMYCIKNLQKGKMDMGEGSAT